MTEPMQSEIFWPEFETWCQESTRRELVDSFVIARMSSDTANLIGGVQSFDVKLSAVTLAKQLLNHPDVVARDYQRLQGMLDTAEMWTDRGQHFALIDDGVRSWLAVVKVTKSHEAVWLQSLRRTNHQDIARLRGRSILVRAVG